MRNKRKTICSVIRVISMSFELIILGMMYHIGLTGAILIGVVNIIWAITVDVEHDT